MIKSMTLLPAALSVLLLASTAAHADPAGEIRTAYAAWDAAFNKGDVKAIAAFYEQDAIFLPATHDVIKGADGVQDFFGGLFKMGVTAHKLELIEARGDENMLIGMAKWSATGKDDKGSEQPWSGIATHVFEKQTDGSLKLTVHTFN